MKIAKFFCSFVVFFVSCNVSAQIKLLTELQTEMVSSWIVTIDGISRIRTLKIGDVTEISEGVFSLDAVFGFSDGKLVAIKAKMNQTATERKLELTTQTGVRIVATQGPNGIFTGTFTPKGGDVKAVIIEKFSGDNSQLRVATASQSPRRPNAESVIIKPAADVPAECVSFGGEWTGKWSQGGIGQQWLWVMEIDAKCNVKLAYLSHEKPPIGFDSGKIVDGTLSFLCNRSTGGTCSFSRHDDVLWASYGNPSGGTNNAVFERIR